MPTCVYAEVPAQHLAQFTVCPNSAYSCETYPEGAGAEGDLILYVTNEDPSTCGSRLAAAAACAFDPVTNRPVAGNVILCQISPDNFDSDLTTAVHEMLHVLVSFRLLSLNHTNQPLSLLILNTTEPRPAGMVMSQLDGHCRAWIARCSEATTSSTVLAALSLRHRSALPVSVMAGTSPRSSPQRLQLQCSATLAAAAYKGQSWRMMAVLALQEAIGNNACFKVQCTSPAL